jgi:hypothetical protein
LRVRSGEIHVIGTDESKISVEISGKRAYAARDLKSNTDLYARIPAGEVHVENIANNQDIQLHAGDLTVEVGDSADYSHVDASVIAGEVDAPSFGEYHGGLFRSFRHNGSGRYRLHAHVGAGQLTLVARASARSRGASLPSAPPPAAQGSSLPFGRETPRAAS